MRFSIVSAVIASAALAAAAPASEPGKREMNLGGVPLVGGMAGSSGSGTANGVTDAVQQFLALIFGAADAGLNNPIDAVTKMITEPGKAPADIAKNLMGSVTGTAKGAGNVINAIPAGVGKDMAKATGKSN
ncbi:hypothetical protein MAJ_01704, partial [Metarhizium majus ARSEF 297]